MQEELQIVSINLLRDYISAFDLNLRGIFCCDAVANMVILECGHLAVCLECGKKVQELSNECPICRSPISRLVYSFRSLLIYRFQFYQWNGFVRDLFTITF